MDWAGSGERRARKRRKRQEHTERENSENEAIFDGCEDGNNGDGEGDGDEEDECCISSSFMLVNEADFILFD